MVHISTCSDPSAHRPSVSQSYPARHAAARHELYTRGMWLLASVTACLVRLIPPYNLLCGSVHISRNHHRSQCGMPHVVYHCKLLLSACKAVHLMPLALGAASLLGRVPRVPPRPPRVWLPPRVDGAGTRDVLGFGAGVWNLGAAVLDEDGLSTKDVSVVLEARSFSWLLCEIMRESGQLHVSGLALELPCGLRLRNLCCGLLLSLLCSAERLWNGPLYAVSTKCTTRIKSRVQDDWMVRTSG